MEYRVTPQEGNNTTGGSVPKVNLEKNLKTYLALEKAIQKELIASAMSVTSGGLGIALAKACVGGMVGCDVSIKNIPENIHPDPRVIGSPQKRGIIQKRNFSLKVREGFWFQCRRKMFLL